MSEREKQQMDAGYPPKPKCRKCGRDAGDMGSIRELTMCQGLCDSCCDLVTYAPVNRRTRAADLFRQCGWRLQWTANCPASFEVNKFTLECWISPKGRMMIVQVWSDNSGVTTFFEGGGETWESLELELQKGPA